MPGEMMTKLQAIVQDRQVNPRKDSYTNQLLDAGMPRIAQKVGEEGVEVAVAALAEDDDALLGEVADLIYHTTVLLTARNLTWQQVESMLEARHILKGGK
jgi:phosphoribosyl-ATP pyrophosphohydrolase/phosphoribosyl-AMP cyclohydrolase